MKELEKYMAMPHRMEVAEDKTEGGFVVTYPELPGCISCGETVEMAIANETIAKGDICLSDGFLQKNYCVYAHT